MKSRVAKNRELYENITSDTNESVVTSGLSEYANQLNTIDDRFERMNIMDHELHDPIHAREFEEESISDELYDTFENEYLKDFLNEVKEYNVRKGYRTSEDTQSNILNSFTNVRKEQESVPLKKEADDDFDTLVDLVHSIDRNRKIIDEVNDKAYTTESEPVVVAATQHEVENTSEGIISIDSLFSEKKTDIKESPSIDRSFYDSRELLLKEGINPDSAWKTGEVPIYNNIEPTPELNSVETAVDDVILNESASDNVEKVVENIPAESVEEPSELVHTSFKDEEPSVPFSGVESNEELDRPRVLTLEESKTIQLKLDEQDKNISTINESMIHANRVLNTVIALVILSLIVVAAVILKMML